MKINLSLQLGVSFEFHGGNDLALDVEFEHTNAARWRAPPEWSITSLTVDDEGTARDLTWLLSYDGIRNAVDEQSEEHLDEQDRAAREREEERRGSYDDE